MISTRFSGETRLVGMEGNRLLAAFPAELNLIRRIGEQASWAGTLTRSSRFFLLKCH